MQATPRSVWAALAAGAAGVALVMAWTALQLDALVSFDESVYKLSAARYADGGLGALLDDDVARGTARLYSLLIAPAFALLPGDAAVRAARALNPVLWAATAVPVFLLARRVVASPWHAVAAALLTIAVPWATISTVLFSESLSYLLFATALLAMTAALRAPSARLDLLVLVLLAALVATRMQLLALPVAWLAVVLALELPGARARLGSWRRAAVATQRRFPFLLTIAALAIFAGLVLLAAGVGDNAFRRFAGPYSEIQNRRSLPGDVGLGALFEVAMFSLGMGLVPVMLAVPWWRDALRGLAGREAFRFAVLASVLLVALFGVTLAAQGGWQGPDVSEERYYIYAVPAVMIAAAAALGRASLRAGSVALVGVVLAGLLAVVPTTAALSAERAFLVPVAASSATWLPRFDSWLAGGLGVDRVATPRDLLAILAIVLTAVAVIAWRRARWVALVPALALQVAFASYALAAMHGKVDGVPGVVGDGRFHDLAWVDRTTPGGPSVAVLDDRLDPDRAGQISLVFWNDELGRVTRVSDLGQPWPRYPVSALELHESAVGDGLELRPSPPGGLTVAAVDSPVLQLEARRVARSPRGDLVLLEPASPARATWTARGLAADGGIARPVALAAAPARVAMTFDAPPGGAGGTVAVTFAGRRRQIAVAPGATATVRASGCGQAAPVRGEIVPVGAPAVAVRLRAVRLAAC